ncbi:MAG: sensor histidine kinase [Candidatus Binatia bacterium]
MSPTRDTQNKAAVAMAADWSAGSPEETRCVEAERVKILAIQMRTALAANLLNTSLIVLLLVHTVPASLLFIWLGGMAGTLSLRAFSTHLYYNQQVDAGTQTHWRRQFFLVGAGLTGALWGITAIVFFPYLSQIQQFFLTLTLCGTAAGAVATLGADKAAFVVFVAPIFFPTTIRLMQLSDTPIVAGILTLSFVLTLFVTSRSQYETVLRSLTLRFQNLHLIQHLSAAKQQAEMTAQQMAGTNHALHTAILEARASEKRFRLLSVAAPVGIFLTDSQGRYLYVNPRLREIIGRSEKDQFQDDWLQEISSEKRQPLLREWRQALHRGQEFNREFQILRSQDEQRWVHIHAKAIHGEDGKCTGYIGAVEDITERKEIEGLKDELVAIVSHELRTPLASLRGFAELMLKRTFPVEKQKQFLEIIHSEAVRLTALINDFLDLQRIESGRQTYHFTPTHLPEVLSESLAVFQQEEARHVFRVEVQDALPVVQIDADRIRQVLANLLSNAIKFSPHGGVITVSVRNHTTQIIISVTDQGVGIPPDAKAKLFGKFFRVDNQETRSIGGTGLGLALVKQIVEAHGGQVGVESQLGQGSTFFFTLPLAPVQNAIQSSSVLVRSQPHEALSP